MDTLTNTKNQNQPQDKRDTAPMTYSDPIDPKVNLRTPEGVREFLEWLYDPEVDKAFEQLDKENEQDEN
jgi:hypothetical protein